jgi:serine/threonine protein kinase
MTTCTILLSCFSSLQRQVYFIVMERLLGGSLNDRVASNRERSPRIRAEQCLPMLAGLTQALGYLHIEASATHYIVHRDIKVGRIRI